MLLNVVGYNYLPTETKHFQGDKKELQKQLKRGYEVIRGGNGSYVMAKPSIVEVIANVDGKKECFDVKEAIRREYGRKRVSEKLVKQFIHSIENGKKEIHYIEGEGIKIQ